MEHKHNRCDLVCDRLPPLSTKYPWFVAQNLETGDDTQVQIFYTLHDHVSHYHCRLPQLLGKRIQGCFHGWVILSHHPHNVMWSLWNPVTSKFISLPPLDFIADGDPDNLRYRCLSSPPDDPDSALLFTRTKKPNIVFYRLDRIKKKSRWTEMSYAKQVRSIFGVNGFLHYLTCCNGKVYALARLESPVCGGHTHHLVQVDMVFKETAVVITLFRILEFPHLSSFGSFTMIPFLKGSHGELFNIAIGFKDAMREIVANVYLHKLDMNSMMWKEVEDLKDTILSIELANDYSEFYSSLVATELGGYIHILGEKGKVIYSYHVKDKTISLSYMPCLVGFSHVSAWAMLECRSESYHGETKWFADFKVEKDNEIVAGPVTNDGVRFNCTADVSHLLNIPFHVLEMVMEFSVGVEYLKFRATCKRCHLAAPLIKWSDETASKRLQTYSLVSPWLMVFDKHQGIITFTDLMFGDKYFIETPRKLIADLHIYYSRYGWLLIRADDGPLMFFNPFTSDIRELPNAPYLKSFCFSAPPTCPDCMVVGFTTGAWSVCHVGRGSSWQQGELSFGGDDPYSFRFPTFHGQDLYALCSASMGAVDVFKKMGQVDYSWEAFVDEAPTSCRSFGQDFLVKCDQHLLLVIVRKLGESIELFKSNDYEEKWDKLDGLGRHVIYICDETCLCIEAKTPKMENTIYFPRLHSKNGNIMFYSLETCKYHIFNGDDFHESFGDFVGTKHYVTPHTWIEPSWS